MKDETPPSYESISTSSNSDLIIEASSRQGLIVPPRYGSINTNTNNNVTTEVNSAQEVIATYKIYKNSFFKKKITYWNLNEFKYYEIEVSSRSAKLLDYVNGSFFLKYYGYDFITTTWNITYFFRSCDNDPYLNVYLIKKTFELQPQYRLVFKKYDVSTMEYIFTLNSMFGASWHLYYRGQLILKYNRHFFKNNTLVQYQPINSIRFKIILLTLSFIITHRKSVQFKSQY